MKKNSIISIYSPEKIFLILSLLYGTLLLFIIPPFQVPDEQAHFWRSYQVSDFKFIGEKQNNGAGGYIPSNVLQMTIDLTADYPPNNTNKVSKDVLLKYALKVNDSGKDVFVDFRNTVLYPPVVYLPQSIGINISKICKLPLLWMVYLGRLLNLIVFIALVFYAIKAMPVCKWGMFLLALMPMTISQAASLSADSFTFGVSFLLIALILKLAINDNTSHNPIKRAEIIKIAVLSFFLGLSKLAYVMVPLLFVMIPICNFSSVKAYVYSVLIILFSTLFGFVIWSIMVRDLFIPILNFVNPQEQLNFVINHPLIFLKAFATRFFDLSLLRGFVGNLGWLNNEVPKFIVYSYSFILLFCAVIEKHKSLDITLFQKLIIVFISFSSFVFIGLLMYLSWNKIGSDVVEGLQGRYFIPVSPLLLLPFHNKFKFTIPKLELVYLLFSVFVLSYTLVITTTKYYI